jgi:hypothetical protein
MGLEFETTGSISFEPGPYEGHLLKMDKRSKQFTDTDDDGNEEVKDRSFIIWNFGIDEEGYEDVTLTAVSSTSFGPKSKGRAWANAILRRKLEDGEKVREPQGQARDPDCGERGDRPRHLRQGRRPRAGPVQEEGRRQAAREARVHRGEDNRDG